jgi:hypothetical protein
VSLYEESWKRKVCNDGQPARRALAEGRYALPMPRVCLTTATRPMKLRALSAP